MMPLSLLTLRTEHLTISLDAPSWVVERLWRVRRAATVAASRQNGHLAILSHAQRIHLQQRDVMAAVEVFRDIRSRPARSAPSGDADDLQQRVDEAQTSGSRRSATVEVHQPPTR